MKKKTTYPKTFFHDNYSALPDLSRVIRTIFIFMFALQAFPVRARESYFTDAGGDHTYLLLGEDAFSSSHQAIHRHGCWSNPNVLDSQIPANRHEVGRWSVHESSDAVLYVDSLLDRNISMENCISTLIQQYSKPNDDLNRLTEEYKSKFNDYILPLTFALVFTAAITIFCIPSLLSITFKARREILTIREEIKELEARVGNPGV